MECKAKDGLERHLSDIRILAARTDLTPAEGKAAARAEQFAIDPLKGHNTSGHAGKRCPFATHI